MRLARGSKSLAAWLAGLGVAMAALAPTMSQALRGDLQTDWVAVCSASGAKAVKPGGLASGSLPSHDPDHVFEHCPYCSPHATTPALPATPSTAIALLGPSFVAPQYSIAERSSRGAWTLPRSRAPPAFL